MPGYTDILDELGYVILDESSNIVLDENDVSYPGTALATAFATGPEVVTSVVVPMGTALATAFATGPEVVEGVVVPMGTALATAFATGPRIPPTIRCYAIDCIANRVDYPLHTDCETDLTLCVTHTWLININCPEEL